MLIITILIFLIVLSVLVFAHELGHFWTARLLGVKAEEFGLGFPPRAIGWQKNPSLVELSGWRQRINYIFKLICFWRPRSKSSGHWIIGNRSLTPAEESGGTVYSLNWIPLGGFVKIKGQDGEKAAAADSFASKSVGRRFLILAAGVFMNIVLAFILFSAVFALGSYQTTSQNGPISLGQVVANSPAAGAGLKVGDQIVNLDDQEFTTISAVQSFINNHSGQAVSITVKRGGQNLTKQVVPKILTDSNGQAVMGVVLTQGEFIKYSFFKAIGAGFTYTFSALWFIMVAFYNLIHDLIMGHNVSAALGGPVLIAKITGETARVGFVYLLNFIALLSLNLAVINFLPFPALDGGRVVFLIIEKIKGRPVKREVETVFHNVGFMLLILLAVWVTIKDVINLYH